MQESQRTHRQGKRHTYGSKDSQVESILMATQVALHHNWLPGTRLEHTAPGSTNPNPAGNIGPSSQHFCYTGETAVDVAGPRFLFLKCNSNTSCFTWATELKRHLRRQGNRKTSNSINKIIISVRTKYCIQFNGFKALIFDSILLAKSCRPSSCKWAWLIAEISCS